MLYCVLISIEFLEFQQSERRDTYERRDARRQVRDEAERRDSRERVEARREVSLFIQLKLDQLNE